MKRIFTYLLFIVSIVGSSYGASWYTFENDAGGVGIFQNLSNGKDTSQIALYSKEEGVYSFQFLTQ